MIASVRAARLLKVQWNVKYLCEYTGRSEDYIPVKTLQRETFALRAVAHTINLKNALEKNFGQKFSSEKLCDSGRHFRAFRKVKLIPEELRGPAPNREPTIEEIRNAQRKQTKKRLHARTRPTCSPSKNNPKPAKAKSKCNGEARKATVERLKQITEHLTNLCEKGDGNRFVAAEQLKRELKELKIKATNRDLTISLTRALGTPCRVDRLRNDSSLQRIAIYRGVRIKNADARKLKVSYTDEGRVTIIHLRWSDMDNGWNGLLKRIEDANLLNGGICVIRPPRSYRRFLDSWFDRFQ